MGDFNGLCLNNVPGVLKTNNIQSWSSINLNDFQVAVAQKADLA